MKTGMIVIKNENGDTLFSQDVWFVALTGIFGGWLIADPDKIRVFIDGDEIPKPYMYENDK